MLRLHVRDLFKDTLLTERENRKSRPVEIEPVTSLFQDASSIAELQPLPLKYFDKFLV